MATHEKPESPTSRLENETPAPPPFASVVRLLTMPETVGESTITGKNQMSLPAEGVRRLGWQKGDRLIVTIVDGDTMMLMRRPESWTEYFAGKMGAVFGDHEDTMRFLEEERQSWREWQERHGV